MRILIVLDNLYIPQYFGGVESCTHELALKLRARSHSVAVFCKLAAEGMTGLLVRAHRRLSEKTYAGDGMLGYPVYRAWDVRGALDSLVTDFALDVALVQNWSPVRIAQALGARGIPSALYLHNVFPESVGPGGILIEPNSSVDIWVDAVRRLWGDAVFYREKSAAAIAYSERAEINASMQVDLLLDAMRRSVSDRATARSVAVG